MMRGQHKQVPDVTNNSFASIPLRPELVSSIASVGYELMTPVQKLTLPHLLKGKDLMAQAKKKLEQRRLMNLNTQSLCQI